MVCCTYIQLHDEQGHFEDPVNNYTLFLQEIRYQKDLYSVQCIGNVFHLMTDLDIG